MSRFPRDCWSKKCKHFKVWDMSVDDLCCRCDLLKVECDACDENFSFYSCPLPRHKQIMLEIINKINFSSTKKIIKALLITIGIFAGAILLALLPVLFGEIGAIITLAIVFVGVFIAMKALVM